MALYRKRHNSEVWHWCSNCTRWPEKGDFEERKRKPSSGSLCQQCQSKESRKACTRA